LSKPIRAHDALWDAHRLKEETRRLKEETASFLALKRLGPTAVVRRRGRELRKRVKGFERMMDRLVAFDEKPEDGNLTRPEDARAERIARALLKVGGIIRRGPGGDQHVN
jgi:hypothetical protein